MTDFKLVSNFTPQGDQGQAIEELSAGITTGQHCQTLLGVTGSGKTFTMAAVVEKVNRPTLIITHNKTLAAQLYSEFTQFFPKNAVEYFVSYYDYYQPEAYVPSSDTYIEKDASINERIDRLRHSATRSLLDRRDVLIVASVSCIYGLGSPEMYEQFLLRFEVGQEIRRKEIIRQLVEMFYQRTPGELKRGTFRVRGDTIEIFPPYQNIVLRVRLFDQEIEEIAEVNPLTGVADGKFPRATVCAANHYVTTMDRREEAIESIEAELGEWLVELEINGKLLEAQRLRERTRYDLEMLREVGYCTGIENYSRHLDRRLPGEPPYTLIDYFPDDFIVFIDESHVTIPQLNGMWRGDKARKKNLIDHGFRLPSAYDNRPLRFEEFEGRARQTVFVSATPADYELDRSGKQVIEQVVRPTGLLDPTVTVYPIDGQIDVLLEEIQKTVNRSERVLVTTLTKNFSEELTDYLKDVGVHAEYLHSDINSIDRVKILRDLRLGKFDVLVGINLLREGLDLPEVSLVAIMDADKQGFLRSARSLIQTFGRAARNENGQVILFADSVTTAMKEAMDETDRRRRIQEKYNESRGITPRTIRKEIHKSIEVMEELDSDLLGAASAVVSVGRSLEETVLEGFVKELKGEMQRAVENLDFETAAAIRDAILELSDSSREELKRDKEDL
ncbi:MAG: excinuclease ABC subunit UvrB [bacterium]|nr:excinuclease ABC subunit UvrB [bacterium]